MREIDRRTMLQGMLFGTAFITAGGVAVTTPELAEAVPLAANKTGSFEAENSPGKDDRFGKDDHPGKDDHLDLPDQAQQVQYWRRRRWRRRPWWWYRRRRPWWWYRRRRW